jgi:hypothetical protein
MVSSPEELSNLRLSSGRSAWELQAAWGVPAVVTRGPGAVVVATGEVPPVVGAAVVGEAAAEGWVLE